MNLQETSWPVYKISNTEPQFIEGVWMFAKEVLDSDTGEITRRCKIIDDKTVEGKTLGVRRLKLAESGVLLHPLRKTIYMLGDLIRLRQFSWFIDNSGKVFKYVTETRVPLECRRITKILPNTGNLGSILEVEGLTQRFKIHQSRVFNEYAGILVWGRSHILYDLYDKPFKRTYRRV